MTEWRNILGFLARSSVKKYSHTACDPDFKAPKQEVRYYLGGGVRRESSPTDWK